MGSFLENDSRVGEKIKEIKEYIFLQKETIKQNNRARNWDVGIPQLNHPDYINIYIYM